MVKVDIDDVLQGLIQPIGALKGGFDHPVTSADQIWVYTDPSTHVPLDEYLNNLETGTADITGFFVSNATALTDGKITKASIVGGDVNKCKVGDIVLVADGGIYKIQAVDETNITLVVPALASYATASACVIKIDSKKKTYTSNIPLPTDESIPVYANFDGALCPLVYKYQKNAVNGHFFEIWVPILDAYTEIVIVAGVLKPDGTVELSMDDSGFLLTSPASWDLTKSTLVGIGPNGQERIEIGDNLTLVDSVLSATGGGSGGNVSSRLNLMNDDLTVRTSITAEELKNIKKGLYNSVLYMDDSLGDDATSSLFFPENAIFMFGEFVFSIYKVALKETGSTISASIVGSYVYELLWDSEAAADGTYPITINRVIEASNGGGGGGIYFHSIHIIGEGIGYICCNYYSNYPHHYTLKTFKDNIWAKNIACSGFVEVDGKQYPAIEIERTTVQDGLDIWYFDSTTSHRKLIANTDKVELYDERVFNVATGEERDPPPKPL